MVFEQKVKGGAQVSRLEFWGLSIPGREEKPAQRWEQGRQHSWSGTIEGKGGVLVSGAAVAKYHRLGDLKQLKFILS